MIDESTQQAKTARSDSGIAPAESFSCGSRPLIYSAVGGIIKDFREEYPVIHVLKSYHPEPKCPGFKPGMYESFGRVSVDSDDYFARLGQILSGIVPPDLAEAIPNSCFDSRGIVRSPESIREFLAWHVFGESGPVLRFSYSCSDQEMRTFVQEYCDGLGFRPIQSSDAGDFCYGRDDGVWTLYLSRLSKGDRNLEENLEERIFDGIGRIYLWAGRIREPGAHVNFVRTFVDDFSKGPMDELIYQRQCHAPLVLRYVKPDAKKFLPMPNT